MQKKHSTLKLVLAIIIAGFTLSFTVALLSARTRVYTDHNAFFHIPNNYASCHTYVGNDPEGFTGVVKAIPFVRSYFAVSLYLDDFDYWRLEDEAEKLANATGSRSDEFIGMKVRDLEKIKEDEDTVRFEFTDFCELAAGEDIEDYTVLYYSPRGVPRGTFVDPKTQKVVFFYSNR